ncbi:S-adenosyl-L-methionine-dependent methyltransferase [Xylariaceae sp. FL0594]|nr:S-adenosyl-L-methionine-dependent methyltransferase [Xylariaceae sp. FL0594]
MSSTPTPNNYHQESIASWCANASYWDDGIGHDGNKYWKCLQEPVLRRLIQIRTTNPEDQQRVLEFATGNGLVARWLVDNIPNSFSVLATDVSQEMLDLAKRREEESPSRHEGRRIEYRRVDVTDEEALAALPSGYEIVVMNMALMDVSTIEPLASALPKLLNKGGIFVATLLHPIFFTSGATRNIQLIDSSNGVHIVRGKLIDRYLDVPPYRGVALPGQPAQQVYFHRPLHELFAPFFSAGLVMDALEEPGWAAEDADPDRIESHTNFTQLPAILGFRMRRII